jgi:iron complex transport system substrate-binding protein
LPELGDCWATETNALARAKPTLIIGSVPYRADTVAKLLQWPAPFLATNPRTLADIFAEIVLLGALVGRQAAAQQLVVRLRRAFNEAARRAARARHRPRVYAEAWPHPRISSPPWVAELVEMAGGVMVVPAGSKVSDTAVRQARPDVIVLAWAASGNRSRPESALRNPAWRSVPAVRTGRVAVVADHLLNTPGPPLAEGLRALVRVIHPELASGNSWRA